MASVEEARHEGYQAGLKGLPSTPHKYMRREDLRRAYEGSYDLGRAARLREQENNNG
jgi:hypothetical protein